MILSKISIDKIFSDQEGFSSVEFAIVVLLFFILVFGIIDFGFLFYNQQVITNAGREGARLGIVARPDDYKINKTAITQEVTTFAENNIVSVGDKNFTVNPTFSSGGDYCEKFQDVLTVQVTYDYSFIFLPFATKKLGTTAIMICE